MAPKSPTTFPDSPINQDLDMFCSGFGQRLRQVDYYKFKTSLGYRGRPCLNKGRKESSWGLVGWGIGPGLDGMEKTLSHTTLGVCSEASALHKTHGPSHLVQPQQRGGVKPTPLSASLIKTGSESS